MNKAYISRILNKEEPSGKELGRLVVSEMAARFGCYRAGTGNYTNPFTQKQKRQLEEHISKCNQRGQDASATDTEKLNWLQLTQYSALEAWLEINTVYTQVNNEEFLRYYNGLVYELKLTITTEQMLQEAPKKEERASLLKGGYGTNALETLFPENNTEEAAEQKNHLLFLHRAVLNEYTLHCNYNYVIDRIIAIHNVPEIETLKLDTESLQQSINVYNTGRTVLYGYTGKTAKGTEEEKAKKKEAIDTYFSPLNIENSNIIPIEHFKKEVNTLIRNFSPFYNDAADGRLQRYIYTKKEG